MKTPLLRLMLVATLTAVASIGQSAPSFVNDLALPGDLRDVKEHGKPTEKWEGLAIGPQLSDGSYLLLAGTDNDYSVTQNGSGTQFDVYFDFSDVVTVDLYLASIQCPMDKVKGCFFTNGGAPATLTKNHKLLPGVLHGYKVPAADLGGYVPPASP